MRCPNGRAHPLAALSILARQPLVRWWALAVVLNRLVPAMGVLAFILAGQQTTGSLADGALLVAASAAGFALAAPWRGRRLDRVELRGGLQRDCGIAAASIVALALAVVVGAPVAVLAVVAAAGGVATAGLEGGFRALLPAVVADGDLPRASSLEAVLGEASFLIGPALAGLVAHVAGAVTVLGLMATASTVAAVVASKLPRRHPVTGDDTRRGRRGAWSRPGVRAVYLLALAAGGSIGLFESALPARVEGLGLPAAAAGGFVTAAYLGSLAGGLVMTVAMSATPRDQQRSAPWRAVALLAWSGGGLMATAAAGTPATLAIASVATGLTLAPLYALGAIVLQARLPAGRHAEGFAAFIAAQAAGGGLGNAITSQLLDPLGAAGLLALAGTVTWLSATIIAAIRGARSRSSDHAQRRKSRTRWADD